ncbi:hypothetical protein VPH35_094846 [Triticum aestivum]
MTAMAIVRLQQGYTIRTDLILSRAKIYSGVSFKSSKILGLTNGNTATSIGVFSRFFAGRSKHSGTDSSIYPSHFFTTPGRSANTSSCSQHIPAPPGLAANFSHR